MPKAVPIIPAKTRKQRPGNPGLPPSMSEQDKTEFRALHATKAVPTVFHPHLTKDHLAALAAEALALRCLSRYRGAREAVARRDADKALLPEAPSYREMGARYADLLLTITGEEPRGTLSELAYLDLIEAIIIEQLAPSDGPIMMADDDLCCALQLIHWVQKRANKRDIADLVAEERAKLGVQS
jgi:hypothetical protein